MSADRVGSTERDQWVDVAKGFAIVGVVAFHAAIFLQPTGFGGSWVRIADPLDTVRMPVFFAAAGVFAGRALARGAQSVLKYRVANMAYLYLLWSAVWVIAFQVLPWPAERGDRPTLTSWFTVLIDPNASTWFFYALALYFLGALILGRLPRPIQLLLALIPAAVVGAGILGAPSNPWGKICIYFAFFLAGSLCSDLIRAQVRRTSWMVAGGLALSWLALTLVGHRVDLFDLPGYRLIVGGVAVMAVFSASRMIAGVWLGAGLAWLGQRTIGIYVWHFYFIIPFAALAPRSSVESEVAALLIGAGVIGGATAVSWALWRATKRVRGMYGFPWHPKAAIS